MVRPHVFNTQHWHSSARGRYYHSTRPPTDAVQVGVLRAAYERVGNARRVGRAGTMDTSAGTALNTPSTFVSATINVVSRSGEWWAAVRVVSMRLHAHRVYTHDVIRAACWPCRAPLAYIMLTRLLGAGRSDAHIAASERRRRQAQFEARTASAAAANRCRPCTHSVLLCCSWVRRKRVGYSDARTDCH